jgi:hypothetical protein
MARLTPDELAAFVEASCDRHGVPSKLSDPVVLNRVAVLLKGQGGHPDAQRRAAAPPEE